MNRENGSSRLNGDTTQKDSHRERIWSGSSEPKQEGEHKKNPAEELYDRWTGFISHVFRQMTVKERFLTLAGALLMGAIACFAAEKGIPFLPLGQDLGLVRPLGDALLAASGQYAPAVYLGLIYQAYASGASVSRYLLLTLLFALRTGIGLRSRDGNGFGGFYRERISGRIGGAAAYSLLALGMTLPATSLNTETLLPVLAPLLLPPLLTAAFSGYFSQPPKITEINRRRAVRVYRELSTYLFFILCVYVCEGHTLFGSSLSSLCAIFLTVVSAVRGGTVRGAVLGILLGFTLSPSYAPVLAVTGIFAGVLSGLGVAPAVGLSCIAGCAVAVYAYGYQAILTYVPENIIAVAITSPILKYEFLAKGFPFAVCRRKHSRGVIELEEGTRGNRLCIQSLTQTAQAFNELADSPLVAKKKTYICKPDGEYVCRQLKNGFCDTCPLVCICWENGSRVAASAVKLTIDRLYSSDQKKKSIPSPMRSADGFKCIRASEIERVIRNICETPEARATAPAPEPMGFGQDCRYVSHLLSNIAEQSGSDSAYDAELSAKARKTAAAKGFTAEEIAVFGDRFKTLVVYGADQHATEEQLNDVKQAFSAACGVTFGTPFSAVYEKRRELIFKNRPLYTVTCACAQSGAPEEETNGDSATCFTTDDGVFYSLICDGMGSGTEASECSESAVQIAEKLLRNGVTPDIAAELTGSAINTRGNECFTTFDLLRIDLLTGSALLFKCGAACTFLLRGGKTDVLSAPSMPLGIIGEPSSEQLTLSLHDGDVLVMISDGAAQDEEDEDRFAEYVSACADTSPERMAKTLLNAVLDDYEAWDNTMTTEYFDSDEEDPLIVEPDEEYEEYGKETRASSQLPTNTKKNADTCEFFSDGFYPELPHPNRQKGRRRDDVTVTAILFEKK